MPNGKTDSEFSEFDATVAALEFAEVAGAEALILADKVKQLEEDLAWAFHQFPELAKDVHFRGRYTYLGAAPGVDARGDGDYLPNVPPDAPVE
jgi:hypothetical protein